MSKSQSRAHGSTTQNPERPGRTRKNSDLIVFDEHISQWLDPIQTCEGDGASNLSLLAELEQHESCRLARAERKEDGYSYPEDERMESRELNTSTGNEHENKETHKFLLGERLVVDLDSAPPPRPPKPDRPVKTYRLIDPDEERENMSENSAIISHTNRLFSASCKDMVANQHYSSTSSLKEQKARPNDLWNGAGERERELLRRRTTADGIPRENADQTRLMKTKSLPPDSRPSMNPHRYSTFVNCPQSPASPARDKHRESTHVFWGDGLYDVAKERDEEVTAFSLMVANLRRSFLYDDLCNGGYVVSPVIRCAESSVFQNNWEQVIISVYTQMTEEPVQLKCSPYNRVGEVVSITLSHIWNQAVDDCDATSAAYRLKVLGRSEYMCGDHLLMEYEYIQDCLKFGEEIRLLLLESDMVEQDLARSKEDDVSDTTPRDVYYFFERPFTTSVSRQGLATLMDVFNGEIESLLKGVTDNENPVYQPGKLKQAVKAICMHLSSLETEEITRTIDKLLSLKVKSTSRSSQDGSTSVQLSPASPRSREGHRTSKVYEKKYGRVDVDELEELLRDLNKFVNVLVELYCNTFDTNFTPVRGGGPSLQGCVEVNNMTDNFQFRLISAHRLSPEWSLSYDYFEVECGLYYGEKILTTMEISPITSCSSAGFFEVLKWNHMMHFSTRIKNLPRESRLCLTLYGLVSASKAPQGGNRTPLGWVNVQLFNFNGVLVTGRHFLGLWPGQKANPIGSCTSNLLDHKSVLLQLEFDHYLAEVVFPEVKGRTSIAANDGKERNSSNKEWEDGLLKDLFRELLPTEKVVLWSNREKFSFRPESLPLILASVPWWGINTLPDIYTLLLNWSPLPPIDALGLLKVNFPDQKVRETAVRWMEAFSDDELCDYIPQLVQSLKYECYHDSALARFLIRRALGNVRIMHNLFWLLKDNITDSQYERRFQVILGGLLSTCGARQRQQFSKQDTLVQLLTGVALSVKDASGQQRKTVLYGHLEGVAEHMKESRAVRMPTSPSMEATQLVTESCSYFHSFSVPLKLQFKSKDDFAPDIEVIYKCGDDIRQDMLGMQLIHIMNKLWLQEGLDLKMITYKCMATGPDAGVIEVVREAETLGQIHTKYGITGSLKDDSISNWLLHENPNEIDHKKAVDNFTRSCAGYCVATYILGIGDRHNDNIMIKKTGHLFHIDFSKILGNAQKFINFRRDRAPFVLTADMRHVITGGDRQAEKFQEFVDLCSCAFNIIRQHANLVMNLFSLMLNAGIPQLSQMKDLNYLHKALMLQAGNHEATEEFTKLIASSLNTKYTRVNFFLHNVVHMGDASRPQDSSGSSALLSFARQTHTCESDGLILSARVVDYQKCYNPDKFYEYVVNVLREGDEEHPQFIFRRFSEFHEFHKKLVSIFPDEKIPTLPQKIYLSRSQIHSVAEKRRKGFDVYVQQVLQLAEKVSRSDLVYTFFHTSLRDADKLKGFRPCLLPEEKDVLRDERQIGGRIKFSIVYQERQLRVMIMHCRDLKPRHLATSANPYVKMYLLPDPGKITKRKTKIAKKTVHPTYNETLVYFMDQAELEQRVLTISVWDNDAVRENEFMGGVKIDLSSGVPHQEITKWYSLGHVLRR